MKNLIDPELRNRPDATRIGILSFTPEMFHIDVLKGLYKKVTPYDIKQVFRDNARFIHVEGWCDDFEMTQSFDNPPMYTCEFGKGPNDEIYVRRFIKL